jgi:hypothetical protein
VTVPEQQLGVVGCKRERVPVVALRCRKSVQRRRAIAGGPERLQRAPRELLDILAGRASKLERGCVMVSEHLGVVLGTSE